MFSLRTTASPAFLFDLALVAVVVAAGLLFDHAIPVPPPAQPPAYAQQAGAQQAVAQALRGISRKASSS